MKGGYKGHNPFEYQVCRFDINPSELIRRIMDAVIIPLSIRSVGSGVLHGKKTGHGYEVIIPLSIRSVGSGTQSRPVRRKAHRRHNPFEYQVCRFVDIRRVRIAIKARRRHNPFEYQVCRFEKVIRLNPTP